MQLGRRSGVVRKCALGLFFAATIASPVAAIAACNDIVGVPLDVSQPETSADGEVCVWRTTERWKPDDDCGIIALEVVGWGDNPENVEFKRNNTIYINRWETRAAGETGDDAPAWSSHTLDIDASTDRCAAGWCEPLTYVLRTAGATDPSVCDQRVELRVRETSRTEF